MLVLRACCHINNNPIITLRKATACGACRTVTDVTPLCCKFSKTLEYFALSAAKKRAASKTHTGEICLSQEYISNCKCLVNVTVPSLETA